MPRYICIGLPTNPRDGYDGLCSTSRIDAAHPTAAAEEYYDSCRRERTVLVVDAEGGFTHAFRYQDLEPVTPPPSVVRA